MTIGPDGVDFRAYADEWRGVRYLYVMVRVFKTANEMRADIDHHGFGPSAGCAGQCSGVTHYDKAGRMTGRFAFMWLNTEDLRDNPAEIVAHECVHAAMRYVENKNMKRLRVDLSTMEGEEVLAYVTGSLTRQVNNRLHKLGVF